LDIRRLREQPSHRPLKEHWSDEYAGKVNNNGVNNDATNPRKAVERKAIWVATR